MTRDLAKLRERWHLALVTSDAGTDVRQDAEQGLALLDRLEAAEKTADAGMALHCAIISANGFMDDHVCAADQALIAANKARRALAGKP